MKYKGQNENYKSAEKGILLTLDPLYMGSENLKIAIVGPEIKVVESLWCGVSIQHRESKGPKRHLGWWRRQGLTIFKNEKLLTFHLAHLYKI